jgi:nitrite reductase/ring-hydroxylating ferredoxin subunit
MSPRKRRVERLFDAVADGEALPSGRIDDPEDAEALQAAIELRAAHPATDLPSEAFVARLRRQLADERAAVGASRRVSRRSLLASAGAVAAGAVAAAATGVAIDRNLLEPATGRGSQTAAVLAPTDGQWMPVATQADLAAGTARRFATPGVVGFVSGTENGVVAVSAACTHQGCILQQNAQSGRLDCPCHRTAFGYDGKLLFSQLESPPVPLTRIQVRQRDGSVEVFVPKSV